MGAVLERIRRPCRCARMPPRPPFGSSDHLTAAAPALRV